MLINDQNSQTVSGWVFVFSLITIHVIAVVCRWENFLLLKVRSVAIMRSVITRMYRKHDYLPGFSQKKSEVFLFFIFVVFCVLLHFFCLKLLLLTKKKLKATQIKRLYLFYTLIRPVWASTILKLTDAISLIPALSETVIQITQRWLFCSHEASGTLRGQGNRTLNFSAVPLGDRSSPVE